MDRLTERYRQRLGGTALEEARRPLDTHIALQRRLVELGYLPAGTVADGVYGEATREAIATWQRTTHRPETDGFVSDADAQVLLPPAVMASAGPAGNAQPAASAAPAPVATTPATTAPARRADLRLFGFGIGVILVMAVFGTCLYFLPFGIACLRDSTGKGVSLPSISSLAGRCWAGWRRW
ncbi:peptidoglycan-binding domain-containing protein [Komagataeibacter rhaeticus]|nr:peptidoglycan-binding domain-containing protein [Komagataeibacter rhaeticus]